MHPAPEGRVPEWQRAHDSKLYQGLIKQSNSDFAVTEQLGFAPSGRGEHCFLYVQKSGANTAWVAGQLARHAGVRETDVGFSGLKDRHALTRQWFSVRCDGTVDWAAIDLPGISILEIARHGRKLRRGVHERNDFRIAVRNFRAERAELATLLENIAQAGVPNYFGPQRFGRDGNNLQLVELLIAGKQLRRARRSMAISAARAYVFNSIVDSRVRDGTWDLAVPGEACQLAGSNSFFTADVVTAETEARLRRFDIHPTAALWGTGKMGNAGESAAYESRVAAQHGEICEALVRCGARVSRRATRVRPENFSWQLEDATLCLRFGLPRGSYATSVLREIIV